jgi:hypothetical protein
MVQGYAVCPDCRDFLQQHGYGLVVESAGGCLHQNTHENCEYETQKLGVTHTSKHKMLFLKFISGPEKSHITGYNIHAH